MAELLETCFLDSRYYRFQFPRVLSNLIVSNKGGCNHRYPGIGHVAYIKDLRSRKITARNFRCSQFGAAIAPGLGWVSLIKNVAVHALEMAFYFELSMNRQSCFLVQYICFQKLFNLYTFSSVAKPARQFGHAMQIFLCSHTVKTINF